MRRVALFSSAAIAALALRSEPWSPIVAFLKTLTDGYTPAAK
jgi:hypothetical protein